MLPYLPLWKRLVIAFEEGVGPRSNLMRFYVDPVSYLTTQPGAEIRRIVFVLPSGGEGPPLPEGKPDDRGDHPPEGPLDFDHGKPDEAGEAEQLWSSVVGSGVSVEFLRSGGAIRFRGLWEFVPYNDDAPVALSPDFLRQAADFRDELIGGISEIDRLRTLKLLKEHYESALKTGEMRNVISLFLYAGPIYASWKETAFGYTRYFGLPSLHYFSWWPRDRYLRVIDDQRCSILYPGDGFLDTLPKLDRMSLYLRAPRVNRIGAFQVMHHGARGNWHRGVAARLAPVISVFSSDPKRKPHCHPHRPVLKDFQDHRPVQVDKRRGAVMAGWLRNP